MKDQLPLIRSVKSCIVGAVLTAFPFLFFLLPGQEALAPAPVMYAVLLVLYVAPAALCVTAAVCGTAAMAAGLAAALGAMAVLTGSQGLLVTAVYLGVIVGAFLAVMLLRVPFRRGLPVMIAAHLAAFSLVYVLLQRMTGGELYAAAGSAAAAYLEKADIGDMMLYQLYSMRLIDLKGELAENALRQVAGGYELSSAARQDMLLSLRELVSSALQSFVPQTMVNHGILSGVGCLLLPVRFGQIAAERRAYLASPETEEGPARESGFSDLDMPPFSLWHLPRGFGWQVGAALIAGYLFRGSGTPVLRTAGIILYAAASAVFTVQGAAAMNFFQKSRGTRRGWRVAVPLLLMGTSLLMFLGIFDQFSNFRGLRKPPEPKEEI